MWKKFVDSVLDHQLMMMMQENVQRMLMDDFVQINIDNQLIVVVDHWHHLMMKNNHLIQLNLH
jgi:hypothetical protein